MFQAGKHAGAVTAVVQRVFVEGLCQRVARGDACGRDSVGGSEAPSESLGALAPLRGRIAQLAHAYRDPRSDGGIGAECVEEVVAQLRCFRRPLVRQFEGRWGRDRAGRTGRIGRRIHGCQRRKGRETGDRQQEEQASRKARPVFAMVVLHAGSSPASISKGCANVFRAADEAFPVWMAPDSSDGGADFAPALNKLCTYLQRSTLRDGGTSGNQQTPGWLWSRE